MGAEHHPDESHSLCMEPSCSCLKNLSTFLVDITCSCQEKKTLKIGIQSRIEDAWEPPQDTGSLIVENCHHVELFSRLVNHMKDLKNITIRHSHSVVIHPKLYEARGALPDSGILENIELSNIHKLVVKRYSFRDLQVKERVYLGEVSMASVVSMAFDFEYVKEFSVFASKFDRISMHGIKLPRCKEFNVLGMTTFGTLAAHAIKVECDKFSLAYNWFGHLHDSCFDIKYGLCDIQGNTFNSLAGKPFLSMKPSVPAERQPEATITGLVFRENKFPSEPVLPFASLAMPFYSLLSSSSSYLDIDMNQFPCSCQKLGWLLAFGKFGYNSHSLAEVGSDKGKGTTPFIIQLYRTAGSCIECNHKECIDTEESLEDYTRTALEYDEIEGLSCGKSGLTVRNYDDTSDKQSATGDDDEEKVSESDHASSSDHENNKLNLSAANPDLIVQTETFKESEEAESDEVYNMMLEVTEEVLTQPQHLKIESDENRSEDNKEKVIDAVNGINKNNLQVHQSVEDDGPEEREKLHTTPSGSSDGIVVNPQKYVILLLICYGQLTI